MPVIDFGIIATALSYNYSNLSKQNDGCVDGYILLQEYKKGKGIFTENCNFLSNVTINYSKTQCVNCF